jgi:hypothetical protein
MQINPFHPENIMNDLIPAVAEDDLDLTGDPDIKPASKTTVYPLFLSLVWGMIEICLSLPMKWK